MSYPIFFPLGALAAQTTAGKHGFRQRELRFYSELFSNWVQFGGIGATHAIHNTQVARYLKDLITEGQAKQVARGKQPSYKLTRAGVFTLTSKIVTRSYLHDRTHCQLAFYFLKSYAPQIKESMRTSGNDFSRAHQIEMEQLFDASRFVHRQLQIIEQEIQRLKGRISAALAISSFSEKLKREGKSLAACIEAVAERYPYELNTQRPFRSVLETLPQSVSEWEIGTGSRMRAELIFQPLLDELERHATILRSLS
jgi:hypothetical protein